MGTFRWWRCYSALPRPRRVAPAPRRAALPPSPAGVCPCYSPITEPLKLTRGPRFRGARPALVDDADWRRYGGACVQYLDLLDRWALLEARAELIRAMDARWRPVGTDGTASAAPPPRLPAFAPPCAPLRRASLRPPPSRLTIPPPLRRLPASLHRFSRVPHGMYVAYTAQCCGRRSARRAAAS